MLVPFLIFHLDMDAFYASIEMRDRPELRDVPLIVGGDSRRGVVATANYRAREFGIHSAQPIQVAKRKCPDVVIVPPRMSVYAGVSRQIMGVFESFSPTIEPLSLDEAFLDMTHEHGQDPLELAKALQAAVLEATQLTCSIGIGPNKFLAKLCSDLKKPNGITQVPAGLEKEFIAPLPVRKLWGVGAKTEERLLSLGYLTIGDVAAADLSVLRDQLGQNLSQHLHNLAHAIDHRPINPERERKSVGSETTFEKDLRTPREVAKALQPHALDVARVLAKKELKAGGVRVKIRYTQGFVSQTRQRAITPTQDAETLWKEAMLLLESFEYNSPIRLVGLTGYDLVDANAPEQLRLFKF